MDGASSLPGFHFKPTAEELVGYYLKRKVEGLEIGLGFIPVVDLYKFDPWELPDKSSLPKCNMEWFFFFPREHKYLNGNQPYRCTTTGYWKAIAMDSKVVCQSSVVGYRKPLVFYDGKAPCGKRTNWVMHEYHLCDHVSLGSPTYKGSFALCRLIDNTGSLIPTRNLSEPLIIPDVTPFQASESNEPASIWSNPSYLWDRGFIIDSTKEHLQGQGLSGYFPNHESSNSLSQPYSQYKLSSNSSYSSFREEIESADDLSLFGYSGQGNVSRSTLKRICRNYGIKKWPCHKRSKVNSSPSNRRAVNKSDQGGNEQIPKAAATTPNVTQLQDVVAIKVKCKDGIIKFQLSSSSGMAELVEKVTKRLPLKEKTFSIKYQDNGGDLVLITCDEDLQYCMDSSRSLPDKTTVRMFVDEPIANQAP